MITHGSYIEAYSERTEATENACIWLKLASHACTTWHFSRYVELALREFERAGDQSGIEYCLSMIPDPGKAHQAQVENIPPAEHWEPMT